MFRPPGKSGPEVVACPGWPEEFEFVGGDHGPGVEKVQRHPELEAFGIDR